MASSLKDSPYARYALYALVGVLFLWLLKGRGGPSEGAEAPAFDLPVVSASVGQPARFSLASREDKPVLIEVFASWCGSCRRAAPVLARAHEKYGHDVEFVGVSVDDDATLALEAKRDWRIPYAVAHDDKGAFSRAYKIRVLPTFVLLDREGRIAEVSAGMPSQGRVDAWAKSVLH
jgi:thiol-disulfide isomerase/thioredoxin